MSRIVMPTVAVIEDNPILLDLMRELMKERDYELLPVADARVAVETVRASLPDAILLDIRLNHGITGWDILDGLHAGETTRSIPVIVWSADIVLLKERREWLRQRNIPVLMKPFDITAMYSCLDNALDGYLERRTGRTRRLA